MGTGAIVGKRSSRLRDPSLVAEDADLALAKLSQHVPQSVDDYRSLKFRYATECRAYYSFAAMTRRRVLEEEVRNDALAKLYGLRSALEKAIIADLEVCGLREDLIDAWASKSFFGISAKQGVSVRYALASCVPTRICGGRCYAHDGRDREIHRIFRGALNYFVGQSYECLGNDARSKLFEALSPVISYGVSAARQDQIDSLEDLGFSRAPRIRFSHVGEMAATPQFTNDLARAIRRVDPEISCTVYTRHPNASMLDTDALVVNFTLEGEGDLRLAWVPAGARVVASAWDGKLVEFAAVNFLEHHVEKVLKSSGAGHVCPVTADHGSLTSCDGASCELCFLPPPSQR